MTAMLDSFPRHPKPSDLAIGLLFELVPRFCFRCLQSLPPSFQPSFLHGKRTRRCCHFRKPQFGKPLHGTSDFAIDQHSADGMTRLGIKQLNPGVPVRFCAAAEDVLAVQQELGLSPDSTACQNDTSESLHGRLISCIACDSFGCDVGLSRVMRYNDIATESVLIDSNPDFGWQTKKRGLLLVGPNSVSVSTVPKTFPASLLTKDVQPLPPQRDVELSTLHSPSEVAAL